MIVTFRIRRDTAANWTSSNPVLGLGEPGLETDTRLVKYGDGSTPWTNLKYTVASATWGAIGGSLADQVDLSSALAGKVPATRTISTNAPLTGGGDLSANRTLAITPATPTAAGSMSAADKTKLDGLPPLASANTLQVSAGPYLPVIKTDGVVEVGQYLDFHTAAGAASDFSYRINANGTTMEFSGAILTNGRISRDTFFYFTLNNGNPTIFMDNGDALAYDRAADKFVLSIANVVVATLDANGNLRTKGTVTQSTTP